MKQHKKRNIRGFSHDFLLPVIVVVAVAGIGGYVMLQRSSAATLCRGKVYAQGAKSECVRYAQYMIGAQPDAAFGPNTKKKLVAKTGQSKLNKAAWDTLCKGNYSKAVNKQRDAACKTGAKKPGNPTTGYRVCTSYATYKSPGSRVDYNYYGYHGKRVVLFKTKPNMSCNKPKEKFSTEDAANKANKAAKERAGVKNYNADLKEWKKTEEVKKAAAEKERTAYKNLYYCEYMYGKWPEKHLICRREQVQNNSARYKALVRIDEQARKQCKDEHKSDASFCKTYGPSDPAPQSMIDEAKKRLRGKH